MRRQTTRLLFAATILVALVSSSAVVAAVPRTISYQGVLKDAGGVIVPDGEYDITFRIYGVETEGTALWSETQALEVTAGIVTAGLGSVNDLDLPFDAQYWLGISIETHGELTPRIELTTAPYAMHAAIADSVSGTGPMTDDDWSFDGDNIYRETGRVGIGTALPNAALHVDVTGDLAARFQSDVGEGVGYSVVASNTGSYGNGGAISGEAHWTDGAGSGGFFRGGAVGVKGEVWPTGEQTYVGVRGYIDGTDQAGGGTNYGVYGEVAAASSRRFSGTSIGVYGRATGSGTSYAGYFDGDVEVTGAVRTMGFRLAAAPGTGYVLTSDAAGTGTWQPLPAQGIGGGGDVGYLPRFTSSSAIGNSSVYDNGGMVGIGTTTPTTALEVDGTVYSTDGGFRFPDGTTQTTAAQGVVSQIDAGTGIIVTDPSGPTATVAADIGTGVGQVAAGDHDHDADYIDDGAGEVDAADDFGFGAPTHVPNLDADLLDGQEASAFAGAGHNHDADYIDDGAGEIDAANDFGFGGPTYVMNLDADLLDGQEASAFAGASHDHDAAYVNDDAGEIDGAADFGLPAPTHVTNLDADLLDGQEASAFAGTGHHHDAAYVNDDAGEIDGAADFGFGAPTHVTNLDADLLDGQEASAFAGSGHDHDADYIDDGAGEIDAANDFGFGAPTHVTNLDADLLDGQEASAFAGAAHIHDGRYFTETELNAAGTINDSGNPMEWTRLKNVPTGFADGVDDTGGDGHSLDASDGSPVNAVFVDADGDVGIWTTSPSYALDVDGDLRVTGQILGTADNAEQLDGNDMTDLDARYVMEGQTNSVTTGMIVDGAVGQGDIAPGGVGASEIEDGAVGIADMSTAYKARYVRIDTNIANQYMWNPAWFGQTSPVIRTNGTPGQIVIEDPDGGSAARLVITRNGSLSATGTTPYTYNTYVAVVTEIHVWPTDTGEHWFVQFEGAREGSFITGIVRAGRN